MTLFLFFEHGKWGLIDEKGRIVQAAKYDFIDDPTPIGYSIVKEDSLYGVFDPHGQFSIALSFDSLFFASDSLLVGKKSGEYQLYNLEGSAIPNSRFHRIRHSDILQLYTSDGKKGLLGNGKYLLPVYDTIIQTKSYCIPVQDGKFTFLKSNLKSISNTVYDSIGIGINYLKVKLQNKYGLLELNGKEVLRCSYTMVREIDFNHLIQKETNTSKTKLIDAISKKVLVSGDFDNIIIPSSYDTQRFKPLPEGYYFIQKGDREGVVHKSGNVVLPPKFNEVYYAGWQRFVGL
ncbi:MAG: WG repeat-containing protein, partial [Cytophagales bacterium]|nr:WG repeat-containing protein [Cytophagales bacterium]